jgi:MOSC domain-containing protein YiiM
MPPSQIISLQVGLPAVYGTADAIDQHDRQWHTGFFKQPVTGSVWMGAEQLVGDGQADRENHGGPDKAINAYPIEHFPVWHHELSRVDLTPGAFGENFTTSGLLEEELCIGDIYRIGNAGLVQVSQPRQPCWKLARRWRIKDLALRVQQTGRTGWYFRVLQPAEVSAGMPLALVDRPYPQWTVATANRLMHHDRNDLNAAHALASCPALSLSWQSTLSKR